jgi:hypothetical protein
MSDLDFKTSVLARKNIFDRILRVWSPHLNSYELHVVMVLATTSMSFGYDSCTLSHKGMLDGVEHSERPNEWFIPKINMSDKTLRRSLESLKAKEIVDYTFTGRANCYRVNWEWEPEMGLATPKRLKNGETGCKKSEQDESGWSDRPSSSVPDTEQFGTTDLLYTGDVNRTSQQDKKSDAGAPHLATPKKSAKRSAASEGSAEIKKVLPDNVADRMEAHEQKMQQVRVKRVAKARTKDHSGAFEETWRAAWRETFPNDPCVGWSPKERGQIKHARDRFTESVEAFHDLLDFTVRHWSVLRATALKWMKSLEPVPQASALLAALPQIASAHIEHKLEAGRSQFSKTEEQVIDELTRYGGKTYEQAIATVGEQRGRSLERKETHKLRVAAERTVELANQQAQQAQAALAAAKRQAAAPPPEALTVHEDDIDPVAHEEMLRSMSETTESLKTDGFVWR